MVAPFAEIPTQNRAGVGPKIAAHDFCKWLIKSTVQSKNLLTQAERSAKNGERQGHPRVDVVAKFCRTLRIEVGAAF